MVFPYVHLTAQTAFFTLPDTVCMNSPVKIANASVGATSYYWNFCSGSIDKPPEAINLGNLGGALAFPVFMDLISDNGHYYGFLVNNNPSGLVRLDFGNNMLNTPIVTDLGDLGGVIPRTGGAEGIQVIKNNNTWYAIIVGWNLPTTGINPRMIQVDFGANIANPSPVAIDWGNLGIMSYPTDLYIFNEAAHWYGFTVNATNNTITRFDFGTSFDVPPVATNIGNVGGLMNFPTGVCAVNDASGWHVFVANQLGPLVRLDFGSSLLNAPSAVDLGNPNGSLHQPRDITILSSCDKTIGFMVNAETNDIAMLDFHNDLLSTPTGVDLGNIANFSFPHSITKIFRAEADLYCYIPNVNNNTLSRLKFTGCNNASIPNFTSKDPPEISYSLPGTYNINLMIDDGLPSSGSFCKSITVMAPPSFSLGKDTTLCQGDSLRLLVKGDNLTYAWQDGSAADSFIVHGDGQYQLTVNTSYGCSASDDIAVQFTSMPTVKTLPDTSVCRGSAIILQTQVQGADSVRWTPSGGLSDPVLINPAADPQALTRYIVTAYHKSCFSKDTITVQPLDTPAIVLSADMTICQGGSAQLSAAGADYYRWSPAAGLSDPALPDPVVSPGATGYYRVLATSGRCSSKDSVLVTVKAPDQFSLSPTVSKLCIGDSVLLKATGADRSLGDGYKWITDITPQDPSLPVVRVSPSSSATYQVVGFDKICNLTDTLSVDITVVAKPRITVVKSNDIDCTQGEATLTASGGETYTWHPAQGLSDTLIANPVARTDANTVYTVDVTDSNGCSASGSVTLLVTKGGGSIGYPVSNAFTPNGDGHNDCFGIKYWGYIAEFEMSIFNRWGGRVFYSQNPAQCWDGSFGGKAQASGTFVYMIKAKTLCGDVFRKGTVQLIR